MIHRFIRPFSSAFGSTNWNAFWINSIRRNFSDKIPPAPTWKGKDESILPKKTVVDAELVAHLERLALVDFNNQEGIDRLKAAIRFADQILLVDTSNVEPMDSVLEDVPLYLRKDEVTEGNCRQAILQNAAKLEEEYFVAPPGNIPIKPTGKYRKDGDEEHLSNKPV